MVEKQLLWGKSKSQNDPITFYTTTNTNLGAYAQIEYLRKFESDTYIEKFFKCYAYDWVTGWGPDVNYANELSGDLLSISYTISSNDNGGNKSFNFTFVDQDAVMDTIDKFSQVCWFLVGIRTNNTNGEIIWFSIGFGVIDKPSYKVDAQNKSVSFSAIDLICLIDGQRTGVYPANGSSQWSYKQDKNVRGNIIGTMEEAQEISENYGQIGINFNIREEDFEESYDLYRDSETGEISYKECVITNDLTIDVGGSIYDGIQQILQNSGQYYKFGFNSTGHVVYEIMPEGELNYDQPQYYIDEDEIISYSSSVTFDNIGNAMTVYGYCRDVAAIKDNTYSGDLVCDGETYTHSTTEAEIETGYTYNENTGVLVMRCFCDRLPCTLSEFQYEGDTTWGADTIYLPQVNATSLILYVNNVNLGMISDDIYDDPAKYFGDDYEYLNQIKRPVYGDTNILSVERFINGSEGWMWGWVFRDVLQPKATVKLYDGKYGINRCGRIEKFFQEDAYNTTEKCYNRALYELYCAQRPIRQINITTRPMYWLQAQQLVQLRKGVNDYKNFNDDDDNDLYVITSVSVNNNNMSINLESFTPFAKFLEEYGKYFDEEFNQ